MAATNAPNLKRGRRGRVGIAEVVGPLSKGGTGSSSDSYPTLVEVEVTDRRFPSWPGVGGSVAGASLQSVAK